MTNAVALSINLNKIALIRNSREGNNPDLVQYAKKIIQGGADGITVHPRPDQRHIRPEDCAQLAMLIKQQKTIKPALEFNIEGNPFASSAAATRSDFNDYPGFIGLVKNCLPDQVTLVPDADSQLTSDHGFDLSQNCDALREKIKMIKALGCRVSLFMDPVIDQISRAAELGADRIELYTGPFANAYTHDQINAKKQFDQHQKAAEHAYALGVGINAGHDLNTDNLQMYKHLPHLLEVSIGHAFTIDALDYGLKNTLEKYRQALN
jgi:pyridoxine 5-phosphate synthase